MEAYYYAIVFIIIATMGVSVAHLFENETLSREVRNKFIFIAVLVIVGVLCEFFGRYFNNGSTNLRGVHGLIKAVEFTIAPIIPISYVKIVENRDVVKLVKLFSGGLIVFNAICEFISVFIPFVFYINGNNVYLHGNFYGIYVVMYLSGIALFIVELLRYTQKYQSRNAITLLAIVVFLLAGFSIRLIESSIYSDWLIVAITYLLFIIYYSDLILKVDALTKLLNRKSYENRLKKLDYPTAIILLDANSFKIINDTYGHQCGDIILEVIAKTIISAYGKYAYCYRIGGDEFCVILKQGILEEHAQKAKNLDSHEFINKLNLRFDELLAMECEEYPMLKNGVSKGYSIFSGLYDFSSDDSEHNHYSLSSVKEAVKIADEKMYENKQRAQKNK